MGTNVYFFGPDGSGKSTISSILLSYYSSKKISSYIFWLRGSHLLASLLLKLISRSDLFSGLCNPYYNVCIPSKLRMLWIHIEFWSYMFLFIIYSMISKFYQLTVFERSILDFLTWIIITLNHVEFVSSIYGRFLLGLIVDNFNIYVYANLDNLVKRSDINEILLKKEFKIYRVLSGYFSNMAVDTGSYKPITCVAMVIRAINRKVKCNK